MSTKSKLLGGINIAKVLAAETPLVAKRPPSVPSAQKTSPIDGSYLTAHFNNFKISPKDASRAKNFFNSAHVELEWSIYDYLKLPGETEKHEYEKLLRSRPTEMDAEETEKLEAEVAEMKAKMVKARNDTVLSEVMLLGRCNVGKSSLLNALLSPSQLKTPESYARVRDYAGYTPCLNFYNIGNVLRIVDSPGYGKKGQAWQGELCFRYLERRKEMRRCYLLMNPLEGMNQYDQAILEQLNLKGITYDIVFTKIDRIRTAERVKEIQELLDFEPTRELLTVKPRFYFVNSETGKGGLNTRTGFEELRYGMLESCGLGSGVKPKRLRGVYDKKMEAQKQARKMKDKEKEKKERQ
ncbi:unnamed protein product [Kuraishia capsulata CBS 1993]|uniref:EngB-type G domain-containing protein n=1 Tax=Kuraishia capsulata CBS 1993 TaxID=1382522 RepID=W6MLM9_9ASCO|nr:uncharacterized protein KUCA_T00003402001 [Kuraishia capsulata CBS 1993]CDK27424.1 unnamed protein product [Kuraishia capsulata CBS 1993]